MMCRIIQTVKIWQVFQTYIRDLETSILMAFDEFAINLKMSSTGRSLHYHTSHSTPYGVRMQVCSSLLLDTSHM